jgi:hypothetical protein
MEHLFLKGKNNASLPNHASIFIYPGIRWLGMPWLYHILGSLNNRILIFQFQSLKAQDKCWDFFTGMASFEGHKGKFNPGLLSWHANSHLLPVSSLHHPSLCMYTDNTCLCVQISSSYKDRAYFIRAYSNDIILIWSPLQNPISNTVTFWQTWG